MLVWVTYSLVTHFIWDIWTLMETHVLFIGVSWSLCYHTVPDHIMAGEFHLCYKFSHHKRTNRDSAGKAVLLGGHSGLGLRRSLKSNCRPLPQSRHWPSFPLAFSLTKRFSCPVIKCKLFPQGGTLWISTCGKWAALHPNKDLGQPHSYVEILSHLWKSEVFC